MAKVFKGFNIHLESKTKVKQLRELLAGNAEDGDDFQEIAQEIIDAIDEKVTFDSDSAD